MWLVHWLQCNNYFPPFFGRNVECDVNWVNQELSLVCFKSRYKGSIEEIFVRAYVHVNSKL